MTGPAFSPRPPVDVVVPYAGPARGLDAVRGRLAGLALREGDSLVVADNRVGVPAPALVPGIVVIDARDAPGSYHARNRGAAGGGNPWIVFLDGDVEFPTNLLDQLFAPPPAPGCAVLAGGIVDQPPADGDAGLAVRWAARRGLMDQDRTFARPGFAYAQTANCAVRRTAFEAVGGFTAEVRSGGDADLCFRLVDAGWTLERREAAAVVHVSRATVRSLLRQRLRVGAGAGWLERRRPGRRPATGGAIGVAAGATRRGGPDGLPRRPG
jgi:hypothetical protein